MDKTKFAFSKKRIALIAGVLFLVLGFAIAWSLPKDSQGYPGIKGEIASYAVDNAWMKMSGINYASHFGTIKVTAETVEIDTSNSSLCNGELQSQTEPEAGNHFVVKLDYRTLFGIPMKTRTFHICRW